MGISIKNDRAEKLARRPGRPDRGTIIALEASQLDDGDAMTKLAVALASRCPSNC